MPKRKSSIQNLEKALTIGLRSNQLSKKQRVDRRMVNGVVKDYMKILHEQHPNCRAYNSAIPTSKLSAKDQRIRREVKEYVYRKILSYPSSSEHKISITPSLSTLTPSSEPSLSTLTPTSVEHKNEPKVLSDSSSSSILASSAISSSLLSSTLSSFTLSSSVLSSSLLSSTRSSFILSSSTISSSKQNARPSFIIKCTKCNQNFSIKGTMFCLQPRNTWPKFCRACMEEEEEKTEKEEAEEEEEEEEQEQEK